MTSICDTATLTLIVFVLQIIEKEEQNLDTLASHNCD